MLKLVYVQPVYCFRLVATSRNNSKRLRIALLSRQVYRARFAIASLTMTKGKGNRLRFSLEEDEILINEMGKHPCLFDAKNKLYKDQVVRDNTWVLIAEIVGKTGKYITSNNIENRVNFIFTCLVEECKTRWKSLKDVYWKQQKEIKQGTGSAVRETKKWEHMDSLAFLENIDRCRK